MSDIPARASAVIVGAGIVGNSLACHLARLGWRDLVLVDKGPMPNPGGSTGHASNFIFPIEYSKMMMELTRDSTEQYQELGVFTQSGGIEVARTQARMEELRRRCTAAKAWGIPAQMVSPAEVAKLVPYLDESVILGGAHFPTVGVVDSLRAGTLMREEAQRSGALQCPGGSRGARHRDHRARPERAARDHLGAHHRGGDRDQHLRGLLRGVEPAHRPRWPGPGSRSPRSCTR